MFARTDGSEFFVDLGPVHPHLLFEVLAYAIGFGIYRRARASRGDVVGEDVRWTVFAAATVGAALGAKLLALLIEPALLSDRLTDVRRFAASGKTIVGALLGGWLSVEVAKKATGVRERTGDLFALPLCVGIGIGRVGCFLTGLPDQTYGRATRLPWGIDFGDGVARHPTQLYELAFLVLLGGGLVRLERLRPPTGRVFRTFLLSYLAFRFAIDGLKPSPRFFALGAIQWAALLGCVLLALDRMCFARVRRAS